MLFRKTIHHSGLLGGSSHLVSRDFIAFLRGSANGGRAKKGKEEKTVREEEEGLQEVPSSLLLFFFSSALLFASPSTT